MFSLPPVWLTKEEKRLITGILRAEHDEVETRHSIKTFVEAAGNARVWVLSLIYFTIVIGLYSLSLWLPLMIKGFAHAGNLKVGVISAVPYLFAAVGMVVIGARSDSRQQRRPFLAGSLAIGATGFVLSAFLHNPVLELAALSMAAVGVWGMFGPFWSLPASFLRGSAAAGGIALINSVGNLGGFAGPYLVGVIKEFVEGSLLYCLPPQRLAVLERGHQWFLSTHLEGVAKGRALCGRSEGKAFPSSFFVLLLLL
ncbi:MAG: MFS transporter [Nitrospirae bacterium]|nr:MFS transporter [Nitrospirota bacterium]